MARMERAGPARIATAMRVTCWLEADSMFPTLRSGAAALEPKTSMNLARWAWHFGRKHYPGNGGVVLGALSPIGGSGNIGWFIKGRTP